MTAAAVMFTIWAALGLLTIVAKLTRTDPLPWAAVSAGLGCAAFGVWYY